MSDTETLTFVHRFSRSLQCTMRVTAQQPPRGECHVQSIEWDGQLKPKHLPEYRQWILCTTQHLCDRWQAKILYCLGTKSDETEMWEFEPGKTPKLAKTIPIGIPYS